MPTFSLHKFTSSAARRELVAEASALCLNPGRWPFSLGVLDGDRPGGLRLFDRPTFDRDAEGATLVARYTEIAADPYTLIILND
jgi:hypothetical protein